MAQTWCDLLFAHWPVPSAALRPLIPASLDLDLWEGQAWIGVVPFRMEGIRPRRGAALPVVSSTPEINVRTYVNRDRKPGVWFFSLDAAGPLVVWGARRFYGLPYHRARMECRTEAAAIYYHSVRLHGNAEFQAVYRPTGPAQLALSGTLDHWLTERYCLYTATRRTDIEHPQWPLQPAEANIEVNTMAQAAAIVLPDQPPRLHFVRRLDVKVLRTARPMHEA